MAEPVEYHGSLVAFEGPTQILSTQLRLLPATPHISILPSIQSYIEDESETEIFDAKRFVQRVHDALETRRKVAESFLKESSPRNKRLVFMNGGTPSAQFLCVKAIAEHETEGDVDRAEHIFNNLVKNGLDGLQATSADEHQIFAEQQPEVPDEDPSTKAMRAADALDRLTASLQPNTDVDLTFASRPRSMSLPMYSFDDRFGDAAPFYVFGIESNDNGSFEEDAVDDDDDGSATPTTAVAMSFSVVDYDRHSKEAEDPGPPMSAFRAPLYTSIPPTSPSCIGESYEQTPTATPTTAYTDAMSDMLSAQTDTFGQDNAGSITYRRASVVQMNTPTGRKPPQRTRSLDRTYRTSTRYRDIVLRTQSRSTTVGEEELPADGRRYSCMDAAAHDEPDTPTQAHSETLRTATAYVQREHRAIVLSPAPSTFRNRRRPTTYVDRGTDAEGVPEAAPPFQPILPFTEDLVINFIDEAPDFTLNSIIEAFKQGIYPVKSPSLLSESSSTNDDDDKDDDSLPRTPKSDANVAIPGPEPEIHTQYAQPKVTDVDDYDPFAYHSVSLKPVTPPVHLSNVVETPTQPVPAEVSLPPSSETGQLRKFRECNIADCKTAVAVQNMLRSVLNEHFPPEDQGYHRFHFSVLPEMGGLWKPIFSETAESRKSKHDGRRIDQILAVGAQRGVKKAYLSEITGQLEKLGVKTGQVTRSGKLDFRYLVANAMQAFTTQPLSSQSHDNPFNNSYLLATLIIPHLETYFVSHNDVRFLLLEYPPDHLATVLALQKLVGLDFMKVAQIVDSSAKELLPFTHIRGASITRTSQDGNRPGSTSPSQDNRRSQARVSQESLAMSKANFLLTSSATEAEISNFVKTVRHLLVEVSKFYVPEETLRSKAKAVPPPLANSVSAFPRRTSLGPQSPPLSPPPQSPLPPVNRTLPPRPSSPVQSVKVAPGKAPSINAPSVAGSIKTAKSARLRRPGTSKSSRVVGDTASVYTFNPEEESDYDMEERRLMPIFVKRPQAKKGNSRKALKFLGLA